MVKDFREILSSNCLETIRSLEKIGIRLSGTAGEKQGADWIESRFRDLGLTNVRQQEFPCLTFGHSVCRLEKRAGGSWVEVRSEPAAHSPATPPEGLEGELILIESLPSSARACSKKLGGRVVLMYASVLFHLSHLRRVMDAGPKAILVVDDRFHGDWTVAVGFPRYWVDFVKCPVINVPYLAAWDMVKEGVQSVRITLDAFVRESTSQNVIGEIRGKKYPDEVIVVSGHHDSVANNPGADDNLTGVAAALELARYYKKHPPDRTLRFISYGTEEQLSEGARYYADHAEDADRIQVLINVDAIGAWMGQTHIYLTGGADLARFVEKVNRERDYPAHLKRELNPFSDHFPLNTKGVPSIWYYRPTYAAARHFHHSPLETMEVLSPQVIERTVRHQADILDRVANADRMPFKRELNAAQRSQIRKMAVEWVGVEP